MGSIDIFYQREGSREIEHLDISSEITFGALKALLIAKHGLEEGAALFIEDVDAAVDDEQALHGHAGRAGVKVHLHRCRHIEVTVSFNGKTVEHRFGPGSTVARVKKWAAETKFGMSPEDASEHVLQIVGTHDRPPPGTHLGSLATCPHCRIAFDLVPDQRVNGDR